MKIDVEQEIEEKDTTEEVIAEEESAEKDTTEETIVEKESAEEDTTEETNAEEESAEEDTTEETIAEKESVEKDTMATQYLCVLHNIAVSEGQNLILDDVQYHVREAVIEAYISQDGSASALLQVISGFRDVKDGNVEYPLHSSKKRNLARWMQYVPDDIICYSNMKVKEFLKGVAIALSDKGAYDEALRLCELFEIGLNEELMNLTFSQNRLVAMIQAMIAKPALLLLDRPYDMIGEKKYRLLLKELLKLKEEGTSILIASESYADVEVACDRYLFFKDGNIFAQYEKGELPHLSKVIQLEGGNPSSMQQEKMTLLYRLKKRWCFLYREEDGVDMALRISKTGCSSFTVQELTMEEEIYKDYKRWQL